MKIFDKKLIEFFGTDILTEEIVRTALEKNYSNIKFSEGKTNEEYIARIEEINKIQEKYPNLVKGIELSIKGINYLNKEIWEKITIHNWFEKEGTIDLECFKDLKSISIFQAIRLENLKIPKNVERIYLTPVELNNDEGIICANGVVWIRDVSELDKEKLIEFEKKYNIKNIAIIQDLTCPNDYTGKTNCIKRGKADIYTIDEYRQILEELHSIVDDIDKNLDEEEKIIKIYKNIGKKIRYDYRATKDDSKYSKENVYSSRNMKNGLLKGKCVCVGYAEIMRNACALMGIDAIVVGSNKQNHSWNKVKIKENWYNFDPTGRHLKYLGFLRDEEIFEKGEEIEGPLANKIHKRNEEYKRRQKEKKIFEKFLSLNEKISELREKVHENKEKMGILPKKNSKFHEMIKKFINKIDEILNNNKENLKNKIGINYILEKTEEEEEEETGTESGTTTDIPERIPDEQKTTNSPWAVENLKNKIDINYIFKKTEEEEEETGTESGTTTDIPERIPDEQKTTNNPWAVENYSTTNIEDFKKVEKNKDKKRADNKDGREPFDED